MTLRSTLRWLLGVLYLIAGYYHIAAPQAFLAIMPSWVPAPEAVVLWTGIVEGIGGLALVQPWSKPLRTAGGLGLAAYAVCVFPANINHFAIDMSRSDGGFGLAYHVPRMILQPLLVWLALWTSQVINWPFENRKS